MIKRISLIILIVVSLNLIADRPEITIWNNTRNSSYTIDNQIHIRTETVDLPIISNYLYHLDEGFWDEYEMNNIGGLTLEGIIDADPDESQYCRFKTVLDTVVAMMPAYIPVDIFPPSLEQLSFIEHDPVGDTLMTYNENLDITSSYFGYSDTRFYSAMQNVTGEYPTNSGGIFPSEYYFYVHGIVNPENALEDSVAYGMVYVEIPFLFSSGLYKIAGLELSLDAVEYIGEIEADVVDGTLILSCDIENLTSDVDFGEWPSQSNSLGIDIITGAFALPLEFSINDYAMPSLQFIDQYIIETFSNELPLIMSIDYTLEEQTTEVTVEYSDANGNFPLVSEVVSGIETYELQPQTFDFSETVVFTASVLETDWDQLLIRFSDNGFEFTEQYINNTLTDEYLITLPISLCNSPNPFNPETRIYYSISSESQVSIEIYNLKGQLIESLINQVQTPGDYIYTLNMEGRPSGIYLYRLSAADQIATRKMILTK